MSISGEQPQLGTLQLYILSILWNKEIYGLELMKHLKNRGYTIRSNQLYPALKRLEKLKALESRKEERIGTTRIYYKITEIGRQLMANHLTGIVDIFQEIMLEKVSFLGIYCGDLLQIKPGMKILDISKDFYDPFIIKLAPKLQPTGLYYIVAKDLEHQEMYQDRIDFNQYESFMFPIIPKEEKINLPDTSIDAAIAFFTLRQNSSEEKYKELFRILKPQGKILIVDWPMRRSDVRGPMIDSIFPERRGVDAIELAKSVKKIGFESKIWDEKEGVVIIELSKIK